MEALKAEYNRLNVEINQLDAKRAELVTQVRSLEDQIRFLEVITSDPVKKSQAQGLIDLVNKSPSS